MRKFFFFAGIAFLSQANAQTSSQAIYPDGHGGFVYMPTGKISFADAVVEYTEGTPNAKDNGGPPEIVLGEANYNIETRKGFFTLGCGGTITVRFIDNALTDIEGPDLYIFEVGSEIENTKLEISNDGINWINVGEISGGRAEVDIKDFVKPGEVFYYVRLTDLKTGCASNWPGADIDAIAALGSVMQVTLNSSVLFDVGSYILKPGALSAIDSLIGNLDAASVRSVDIYGHTDSDGSDEMNLTLSKNRANAVKEYILKKIKDKSVIVNTFGKGETEPIATNETETGKASNRRVSMIIYPKSVNKVDKKQYEELSNVLFTPFDLTNGGWFNKYPKPINKTYFPGIFTDHVDETLYFEGYAYFFNGNRVRKYDVKTKKTDPTELKIKDAFHGVGFNRIDACFYLWEEEKICFMKNDSVILYKPDDKTSKAYKLDKVFPGLDTKRPEAVLYYGSGNYKFFFEGSTQTYDYRLKQSKASPNSIKNANWGNLWLDGADAILDDNSGLVYFFKNPR
jgi:OOP family OmpA-OmpF porin